MDILDILIAKKQSFSGQTEQLTRQARKAMNDANAVISRVSEIEDAVAEAQSEAETASSAAQAAAAEFDEMKEYIEAAAAALVDEAIDNKIENLNQNSITNISFSNVAATNSKNVQATITQNNTDSTVTVFKNYTATGQNEDGSMTQKAITSALNTLDNKIKNINTSGGNSGGGNISGNISADDAGAIISIDENGNIIPSSITEVDVVLTQIVAGTYDNPDVVGLELDYANKTYTRLQSAVGLYAGADFDKFSMFGGRKRCIVDAQGNITRFLTNDDTIDTVANQRIMVYQPAFYYLRVPLSTTKTANGIKINKEHLYLADKKYAGFTLHPIFRDANNNPLRYVLIPAFESGSYNITTDTFELTDSQSVDLQNDCLVSIVNTKPISGLTQEFTAVAAKRMSENNGTGWHMTDLKFESMNQMLMMVEYGSPNLQQTFNKGITRLTSTANTNFACNTGSTITLGNNSGQALSTINIRNGASTTYTAEGQCAISYRGMENPYGNMWRFVDGVSVTNNIVTFNTEVIDFKVPTRDDWISAFGYDNSHDWVYLPIESNGANSSLPVGDYYYPPTTENTEYAYICGGHGISNANAGIFYSAMNVEKASFHYQHDTARVMYIPTPNTMIDNHNYNTWYNS